MARNIDSIPFPNWAKDNGLKKVIKLTREAKAQSSLFDDFDYYSVSKLSNMNRSILVERHLINPAFLENVKGRGILIERSEESSIIVNEEDHLRFQTIKGGFSLKATWKRIKTIENSVGSYLPFSFSSRYGYLTSCPTNVGTGIRISLFCHLPGLALSNMLGGLFNDIMPSGIVIRGFFGEGSEFSSTIFQVSNQVTLGFTEEEILNRLSIIAKKIIEMERNAQIDLKKRKRDVLEDKVFRAIGIIKGARFLTMFEFYSLLSALKLGSGIGIIPKIENSILNIMIVTCQPMHIQRTNNKPLKKVEIEKKRAHLVREMLGLDCILE